MRTIIVLSLFLIMGCQNRSADPVSSTPEESPFKALILQGDDPNDYQIHLAWNKGITPPTWYLKRGEQEHELEEIAMLSGDLREYRDPDVVPGKTYHYLLGYTVQGDFNIRGRQQIRVPKDVVAKGELYQRAFQGINRVFFTGTMSSYGGPKLTIRANEIIADDAVLKFVAGSVNGTVTNGLLTLAAKKASGQLKIVAKGSSGGTGWRKGQFFMEERPPGDGSNSPRVHVETLSDKFAVSVERQIGKGGKWYGEPQTPGGKDGKLLPFCVRQNGYEFGECQSFSVLLTKNKPEVDDE